MANSPEHTGTGKDFVNRTPLGQVSAFIWSLGHVAVPTLHLAMIRTQAWTTMPGSSRDGTQVVMKQLLHQLSHLCSPLSPKTVFL